jgi:hypothetical protein
MRNARKTRDEKWKKVEKNERKINNFNLRIKRWK